MQKTKSDLTSISMFQFSEVNMFTEQTQERERISESSTRAVYDSGKSM